MNSLLLSTSQRPFRMPFQTAGEWVFVLLGWTVMGCGSPSKSGPLADMYPTEIPQPQPVNSIEGGTFRYSERGSAVHMLKAAKLNRFEADSEGGSVSPIQVSGGFTLYLDGDENQWAARLQAKRGVFDEVHLHMTAKEEVILENKKGDRLETEELTWAQDSDRVWTRRPVTIYTSDGILHGTGLESDGRFEDYVILNPTGAIEIEVPE